jgi:hypothetical protein
MSVEMRYVGKEKQYAIKYIEKIVKKFIGEGKITYFEINKENKGLVRFINDESARNFIGEIRNEFDREQILINFESFYKNRR